MHALDIDFASDTLDSRDIIAAIEELEAREPLVCDCLPRLELGIVHYPFCVALEPVLDPLDIEEREHLEQLRELARQAKWCCSDWEDGAQLIADHYFTEYAEQLAADIGAVSSERAWPNYYIDWERAARDLMMDYSAVTLGGYTFYVR